MPLLCAVALVQSMRRETVWHVDARGRLQSVLQSTSFLRARTPSLRHFFIDESNLTFHSFQTFRMMIYLRARSHSPRADQVTIEGSAEAS